MQNSIGNYLRCKWNPSGYKSIDTQDVFDEIQSYFDTDILPKLPLGNKVNLDAKRIMELRHIKAKYLNLKDYYIIFYGALCLKMLELGYKPANFCGFNDNTMLDYIEYTEEKNHINDYKLIMAFADDTYTDILQEKLIHISLEPESIRFLREMPLVDSSVCYKTKDIEILREKHFKSMELTFDYIFLIKTILNLYEDAIFLIYISSYFKDYCLDWEFVEFNFSLQSTKNRDNEYNH